MVSLVELFLMNVNP